jgi:hypothetical protein
VAVEQYSGDIIDDERSEKLKATKEKLTKTAELSEEDSTDVEEGVTA